MAKQTVVIIDYGSGNIRSAAKAFEYGAAQLGQDTDIKISSEPEEILKADRLVLPGQGAFADCLHNLQSVPGMISALEEAILKKAKPFLGICVGMQLLATRGLEHGTHQGLGWIAGQVVPMASKQAMQNLKIPHMGWNEVTPTSDHMVLRSAESSNSMASHYYFVHSFMFECEYNHHVLATTEYGLQCAASVGRDNIIGVQFHPEKSQNAGLTLIENFLNWRP